MADTFVWNGAALASQLEQAIDRAMDATREQVEAYATRVVPVDTGRLQRSIEAEVFVVGSVWTLQLSANTPYALAVELGTARTRAQPYLRPAIDAGAQRLPGRLAAATRGVG